MINQHIKISVIIPCFNSEKYIEETLNSVLNQTFPIFEIIVIDDGSTDNSVNILKTFSTKIILITQANSGVSTARNNGIKHATGEWIAFVDSDDIWKPNKLEQQLSSISSQHWSHTNSLYFGQNQDGKTTRNDLTTLHCGMVFEPLLIENFITTSTVIIKRETLIKYGCFDEELYAMEDWFLWLKIAKTEPLHYCPGVLTEYRVHLGSASRNVRDIIHHHMSVIEKIYSIDLSDKNLQKTKSSSISQSYTICSYIAEEAKDKKLTVYCATKAFLFSPFSIQRIRRLLSSFVIALTNKNG
ncbi:glycosyltransferase [Paraglaciecola sp.]|uniref:glycosyltransferase family 2 protein n=1 Tax=Paraglaciecola sp. TaxID=1920173 RepID=UPI0030F48317